MESLFTVFENVMYICAISFQLAAAWLLVGNTIVTRDGLIKAYCAEHKGGIPLDKTGNLLDCGAWEVISLCTGVICLLRIVSCRWMVLNDAVRRQSPLRRKDLQFLKAMVQSRHPG